MSSNQEAIQLEMEFMADIEAEKSKVSLYDQHRKDTMMLNEYQQRIEQFIITEGHDRLMENTLGLVGEAGEVAEKIKKGIRDGKYDIEGLKKELGDVLFYVAALSTWIEEDLSEVAEANVTKLLDRKVRGVIGGNGDNR